MILGLLAAMPLPAEAAPKPKSSDARSTDAKPAEKAKSAPSAVSQASARFGFDLLVALGKTAAGEPNLAVSPASLAAAFALLDLGASPKLHAALLKTLRLEGLASAATAASGLSGRGAGPMPPHFLATTVATRLSRLPKLLARSELYPATMPS